MYRFLLSPGWLGRLAVALLLAAGMVGLGMWQLSRYEERAAVNERIDAASSAAAVPLARVLAPPAPGQALGPAPPPEADWTMVTVTGRYDPANELLIRGRTVGGEVGFEVLTPLVLGDGSAVLVDRGWVPPPVSGLAGEAPPVPPAPAGPVTVTGRLRPGESGSRPVERVDGVPQTRRIHLPTLAGHVPHPLHQGYLHLVSQDPPPASGLTPIPPRHENAWLNAGYAVQWWLFAALVLAGFGWLARREARPAQAPPAPPGAGQDRLRSGA